MWGGGGGEGVWGCRGGVVGADEAECGIVLGLEEVGVEL